MPRARSYSLPEHLRPLRVPEPISPVAIATPEDRDDLIRFLAQIKDELSGGRGDIDLAFEWACRFVLRDGGVALIIRGTGCIEASIGLELCREPLERPFYVRSIWNNVLPMARRTGHAKSLLIAAGEFAAVIGRRLEVRADERDPKAPRLVPYRKALSPAAYIFGV